MTKDEEQRYIDHWNKVARMAHNEAIRIVLFEIDRLFTADSRIPAGVKPALKKAINALIVKS